MDFKVYKSGSQGIRIVKQHKENAVEYMINKFGVTVDKMLIMADSARSNQMDQELLTRFKSAININVGEESRSLPRKNPSVVQLSAAHRGINATLEILTILDNRGSIPQARLEPSTVLVGYDAAMSNSPKRGGIDLTPANMHLQTKVVDSRFRGNDREGGWNDNGGIKFRMDPAMLAQLQNAPGFVPVIINIQPMRDLRQFLGIQRNRW